MMMPTLFRLGVINHFSRLRHLKSHWPTMKNCTQDSCLQTFSLEPHYYGSVLTFNVYGLVSYNFFATILTSNSFTPHISFLTSIFWGFLNSLNRAIFSYQIGSNQVRVTELTN